MKTDRMFPGTAVLAAGLPLFLAAPVHAAVGGPASAAGLVATAAEELHQIIAGTQQALG
ncbi:hypothetical protein [Streptomyces sp. NPDC058613]|uniref:hypothetical protein n=1 Tax=unclassified Streptomyces TaxID=2593676 RepID=UPI003659C4CB